MTQTAQLTAHPGATVVRIFGTTAVALALMLAILSHVQPAAAAPVTTPAVAEGPAAAEFTEAGFKVRKRYGHHHRHGHGAYGHGYKHGHGAYGHGHKGHGYKGGHKHHGHHFKHRKHHGHHYKHRRHHRHHGHHFKHHRGHGHKFGHRRHHGHHHKRRHRGHRHDHAYAFFGAAIGGLALGHLLTKPAYAQPAPVVQVAPRPAYTHCRPTTGTSFTAGGHQAAYVGTICYDTYGRGHIVPDSVRFNGYVK